MENIEVIANAGNIYLLINKKDRELSTAKAISALDNGIDSQITIKTYNNVQIALTFNDFSEIPENQRGDILLVLKQKSQIQI